MDIFICGTSTNKCKCECGRQEASMKKDELVLDMEPPRPICEHKWDGEGMDFLDEDGRVMGGSVSCSVCGMLAIDHDMWAF
jgi:hypothetical protein